MLNPHLYSVLLPRVTAEGGLEVGASEGFHVPLCQRLGTDASPGEALVSWLGRVVDPRQSPFGDRPVQEPAFATDGKGKRRIDLELKFLKGREKYK